LSTRVLSIFSKMAIVQFTIDFLQIRWYLEVTSWQLDCNLFYTLESFLIRFHFHEIEGRARVFRQNKNDDQRNEEKRVGLTVVWHGSLAWLITVPKRVLEGLSNQFWTVASLVAIKRRTEYPGRNAKEICCPCDGESEN